jgi:hypothetical protein
MARDVEGGVGTNHLALAGEFTAHRTTTKVGLGEWQTSAR